jgi:hypothetical protein
MVKPLAIPPFAAARRLGGGVSTSPDGELTARRQSGDPQPLLKIFQGHARRQMNIAAYVKKRLGDHGALERVFHVEDEKGSSLAAFEAEICCLRLELLDEGPERLLQRSRFQRVAPMGRVDVSAQHHTHVFPPFGSTPSSLADNLSAGEGAPRAVMRVPGARLMRRAGLCGALNAA